MGRRGASSRNQARASPVVTAVAERGAPPAVSDVEPTCEPRWCRALAFAGAALVAAFGAVGLLLAVFGVYRPLLAFSLGALAWLGLLAVARPLLLARGSTSRAAHAGAAAAVVVCVVIGVWHAGNNSQHVLINRDAGSYATTGRWVASHGDLTLDPRVGPFADEPSLQFHSFGVYDSEGKLTFQFAHLLPALLAQAHRVGGDGFMFAVPGLLSGAALLALFVAAWRLVRNSIVALGAAVAFAFTIPTVWFARDTYSEIPSQVLLFTALWILLDRVSWSRPRSALVAGLLVGLLQAVRVDALAFMLGVPLLFAVAAVWSDNDRPAVLRSAGMFVAGVVPGLVLGLADLELRSPEYFGALSGEVQQLVVAALAMVLAAALLVFIGPKLRERIPSRATSRAVLANGIAVVTVLAGFATWILRPRVQHVRIAESAFIAGFQNAAGVAVDPTRSYYERSLTWLSWYLGPVCLAAAIFGLALLLRSLVIGRERAALALLLLLGPASALYLWRASATPDQVWVMRRYIVSAIPFVVLLAFWFVALLWRSPTDGWRRPFARAAATVIAIIAAAVPISTTVTLRDMAEQRSYLGAVRDACGTVGRGAAIVVLQDPTGIVHEWVPQTLRSFCDVPVARLPNTAPDASSTLRRLASGWAAEDRRLFVVAGAAQTITDVLPDAEPVATRVVENAHFLEQTLFERPDEYVPQSFALALAEVPTT
jgi:hypothetical protein